MAATLSDAQRLRLDAARRLLAIKQAQSSFMGFVRLAHPNWVFPPFHVALQRILDLFERRELRNANIDQLFDNPYMPDAELDTSGPVIYCLLVTMPPRHSKSTYCTVLFPAYCVARNPQRYVMSCSYNAPLAADFGREVRDTVSSGPIQQAFPSLKLAKDSQAADVWRTDAGGAYFGQGMGGTTAGRPANILVVDDPIKAREEADSLTQRNKAWSYYVSSLAIRLQPEEDGTKPLQLMILTRWHPDDPAGRIMASDDWKDGLWGHLNMPARRELPDGTLAALWPERFDLEFLSRREKMSPRDFASLYQQQPFIKGGNIVKSEWWRYYDPEDLPKEWAAVVIAADTAFKTKETNDYSVIITGALTPSGDIYLLDVIRKKLEYPDLRRTLVSVNALWRGRGLRGTYLEDKASGQSLIQDLRREGGIAVIPVKALFDKVARISAVTPLIEGGRVFLPASAPWLDDFVTECTSFPSSTHDDQVDALAILLDALSRMRVMPTDDFDLAFGAPLALSQKGSLMDAVRKAASGLSWKGWGE